MNQTTCAVTGSNGYVGKHIVNALRQQNYLVYELCRSVQKSQELKFFLEYALDNSVLPNLNNIDVLIHCAYDFSANSRKKSQKINLDGSLRLLQHAKNSGVKRIILISTMSAFEKAKSVYGKTKLALEKEAEHVGAIIVRPGLVFGQQTQGIVGAMQKFVKKFPVVPLIGDGRQEFYPCYIDELCRLIICLLTTHQTYEKPIVAASKQKITLRDIILALAKANHKKVLLIPIPFNVILIGLKFLEIIHVNIGLRSDSLIGAKFYNKNPDFSSLDALKSVHFSAADFTLM